VIPEVSPMVNDAARPLAPPQGEAAHCCHEMDVMNDDVMIEVAPERPRGTIRVRLIQAGRSSPIPAEDPWAE
jgi:hypothetical protein